VPPSYEADQLFDRIIRNHKIPVVSYVMNAGDACVYSGETLHSTYGNESRSRREALAVSYFADGTRVMYPNHEHRRVDMEEFLPGLKPDDPAASFLNPLLYTSED
jgi:ectoine hydroxylase-related dioxygenase (phytanoyl-CoA dioxygenase family)